jgi:hypothetical protein
MPPWLTPTYLVLVSINSVWNLALQTDTSSQSTMLLSLPLSCRRIRRVSMRSAWSSRTVLRTASSVNLRCSAIRASRLTVLFPNSLWATLYSIYVFLLTALSSGLQSTQLTIGASLAIRLSTADALSSTIVTTPSCTAMVQVILARSH